MRRAKLMMIVVCGIGTAAAAAGVRLAAQPEPYKPIMKSDAPYELILPPGTYQTLILAFEGGANTKLLKATLEAPSGHMTVLVPAGQTLVLPLSSARGDGWTITQPVTIKLTQPAGQVHATAIAPAGPVKLAAK